MTTPTPTPTPVVSVVLPTFNRLAYLRAAVESVFAQTLSAWELLIADDGSDGETRGYLLSLVDARVRTLWLRHSGNPAAVRNAAIRTARGRYLAFLDSDDLWLPTKLEVQLAALRARPGCRWSYTAAERLNADGQTVPDAVPFVPHEGAIQAALLKIEAYVAMPTVVAERTLVAEAGGFDERQRFGEDYDLWSRLSVRSDVVVVNERLARVRLHAENFSHDRIGFYQGWLQLYAKAAGDATDAAVQAICRDKRAELSLGLANLRADRHETVGVAGMLLGSLRRPEGAAPWWGMTKALARSAVPGPLLSAYRHLRRRPP